MHLRRRRTTLALGSLAVLATISLSACGGDSDSEADAAEDSTSAPAETPSETPSETPTESTEDPTDTESVEEPPPAPSGAAGNPSWALPAVTPGEKISTVEVGDVTVDVYQVGTAKADDTGNFSDPDTNKPLIEVGDTLVFVNYVITNNGAPLELGSSLVNIDARYDDWPYLGGMDGLTSDELEEAQGVHDDSLAPGGFNDAGIYVLGTGESYSWAENFEYQKNSPIGFDVSYTPVDDEGELLNDDRVEGEGTGTIV